MIEVGEYIRTYDGIIGKVKYVDSINVCIITNKGELESSSGIKNNKERLIDLIEVGDYVNGREVKRVINNEAFSDSTKIVFTKKKCFSAEEMAENKDIKTILTKELFEANCYKVKEE